MSRPKNFLDFKQKELVEENNSKNKIRQEQTEVKNKLKLFSNICKCECFELFSNICKCVNGLMTKCFIRTTVLSLKTFID